MPAYKLSPPVTESCEDCPLCHARGVDRQVPTEYRGSEIDVLFIAEAPGNTENSVGRPVVGRTGKILRRVVRQLNNGNEDNVAYGNVVRCRPTRTDEKGWLKDRKPSQKEVVCCLRGILRDINKLKPKQIVVCGDSAAKALVRNRDGSALDPKVKITDLRGGDFIIVGADGKEYPAIVTYHFAYVFRTPNVTSIFREDIAKAFRRTRGHVTDYSTRGKSAIILDTVASVKEFLLYLAKGLTKKDVVAIDYETASKYRLNNSILCVGFAKDTDQGYVIPVEHAETPFDPGEQARVKKLLQKFFSLRRPSYGALVAHNLQFECTITLDQFKTYLRMPSEDTMLRAHALNEDRKGVVDKPYALKTLCEQQLGFYHYHDDDIAPVVEKRNLGELSTVRLKPLAEYNAMDCYVTYRLYKFQREWAKQERYNPLLVRLGRAIHGRVSLFLASMEHNGLRVDQDQVRRLLEDDSEIVSRQEEVIKILHGMASVKQANKLLLDIKGVGSTSLWGGAREDPWLFHINKPESNRTLYFDVLKLVAPNKSKKTGKASVDKALFKKYEGVPEVDLYAEWRQLTKVRSTNIEPLYHFLHFDPDMRDQRVRPHFKPTGTITGRISSHNPNVLNIPKTSSDNPAVKAVKRLYICDPGYVMVCADYSQAEVRWLAEITQDPKLIRAFREAYTAKKICRTNPTKENKRKAALEGDFHLHTASMIHGVPLEKVTKKQRGAAKATMFGLVYGMSTYGLAARLGMTYQEAENFIEQFFAQFPKAKEWLDMIESEGFKKGRVISPTGRRKLMSSYLLVGDDDLNSREYREGYLRYLRYHKSHEDNVCRNAPIQGVASDTNLLAGCQLLDFIIDNQRDWRIINTVYDSIMIEVPFPEIEECIETAQSIMEGRELFKPFKLKLKVPFAADFSVGVNWGDQYDISYDSEKWQVTCKACGAERKEDAKPTNRRCEECGSKRVRREILEGPLKPIIKQLDRFHKLSELWD